MRTNEQLAAEAAREDSDGPAFAQLVRRHQEPVWRICYRLMGNAHDAQDAAQEVFVRLFTGRHTFAGRSKYSTWVHGIAVRTCLTLRRGRGRRERRIRTISGEKLQQQPSPAHDQVNQIGLDLAGMLEQLGEEDRALLILKYAEGCSYEQLAAIFQLSVSACKMRISRARNRLKQKYPEQTY